jgi:glycosyltransferase involved in cell wall biosynthesis
VQLIEAMSMVEMERGEIIVVDNNSTDGTVKVAKAKNCKVVHEPFRQIAKARNTGASFAQGKYLFFIDADTLIPGPTLREALRTMQQDEVGGGGSVLSFDTTHGRFWSGKVLPAVWNFISKNFSLFAGSFVFCRTDLFFRIDNP